MQGPPPTQEHLKQPLFVPRVALAGPGMKEMVLSDHRGMAGETHNKEPQTTHALSFWG